MSVPLLYNEKRHPEVYSHKLQEGGLFGEVVEVCVFPPDGQVSGEHEVVRILQYEAPSAQHLPAGVEPWSVHYEPVLGVTSAAAHAMYVPCFPQFFFLIDYLYILTCTLLMQRLEGTQVRGAVL